MASIRNYFTLGVTLTTGLSKFYDWLRVLLLVSVMVLPASASGEPRRLAPLRPDSSSEPIAAAFTQALLNGARNEVSRQPVYRSAYYRHGYPPASEGVCTDLIWRAFLDAGYDLKKKIDADIFANPAAYPRVNGRPDPHIDFRRVPNQLVFFRRHAQSLTLDIVPGDPRNLEQWRAGDIVSFRNPDHIAILSDRRNRDGIPYLLHNDGPVASESDSFMDWYARGITGHFRYLPR